MFILDPAKRELPVPFDFMTVADPATPTGLRVSLGERCNTPFEIGVDFMSVRYRETIETNDGWSTMAPFLVSVSRGYSEESLARTDAYAGADSPIWLFEIPRTGQEIKRLGVTVTFTDVDSSQSVRMRYLAIRPLMPLLPKTRHALLIRHSLTGTGGKATMADRDFAKIRDNAAETDDQKKAAALISPVVELLVAAGMPREEISLVSVFTTLSVSDDYEAVSAQMRDGAVKAPVADFDPEKKGKPDLRAAGNSPPEASFKAYGTFPSPQYTDKFGQFVYGPDGKPAAQRYEDLYFWLLFPKNAVQPFNLVMFQHGLGSDKESVFWLARPLLEKGIAVIAIDAVTHGSRSPDPGNSGFQFLNIAEPKTSRDNFRQTTVDHMQLSRLMKSFSALDFHPFDSGSGKYGDGTPDLDVSEIAYYGNSLGAIIGGSTMAVVREFGAGVLNVGGGTLMDFVNSFISDRVPIMKDMPEIPLYTVAVGSILDKADPSNMGRYVISEPLSSVGRAKQILLQEAIDDETVPNITTEHLARALGLPLLTPLQKDVWGLERTAAPTTMRGLFQFQPANHNLIMEYGNDPIGLNGERARRQVAAFFRTWFDTGTADIINP
jgi:hypothetical protein